LFRVFDVHETMKGAARVTTEPPYRVKQVEPVMIGADVAVRRFVLAAGEAIPWHRHTDTDDLCVLLSGSLRVETRGPDTQRVLAPGGSHRTAAGTPHRLSNAGAEDCAFLLIQGVGRRDFVKLEIPA
jgi:quercetin dioxygenase-like cupin family protein